MIGDKEIPAGAYTLFSLPKEDGTAQLIVNKQIGQWGETYDEKQDLVRIDLKTEAHRGAGGPVHHHDHENRRGHRHVEAGLGKRPGHGAAGDQEITGIVPLDSRVAAFVPR